MQKVKSLAVLVVILMLVVALAIPASAEGWLSFFGSLTSVGGAVAACTPTGVGQVVGGVAGLVEVSLIGTDVYNTAVGAASGTQPTYAALPATPAYSGAGATALLNGNYQHLTLQGDSTDPLATAANLFIDRFNIFLADYRAGQPREVLRNDGMAMGAALRNVANEYDALGFPVTITQADVQAFQTSVGTSGLPAYEVAFLQNAGIAQSDIGSFASYTATAPTNLAESVTLSRVFHDASDSLVPEPGSLLALGSGLVILVGAGIRRRQ